MQIGTGDWVKCRDGQIVEVRDDPRHSPCDSKWIYTDIGYVRVSAVEEVRKKEENHGTTEQ